MLQKQHEHLANRFALAKLKVGPLPFAKPTLERYQEHWESQSLWQSLGPEMYRYQDNELLLYE